MTHTPLPWTAIESQDSGLWYIETVAEEPILLASMIGSLPNAENEANARLIVRAVNSHPALLAVCKEIAEHGTDDWDARMITLHAAITLAKGGA